ncbi:MAG: FkbM family methyltransferase [Candidatus Margulisiibacteriota bacterium]|nr:MAG: hypothetical protein A2X43_00280 [Candidatus Margulisbacteria bacterium GWD2_39_127]PZM79870.1 MAG: FkbM family methyltransferase [Candidatus Margulisiibacteriota bacterium]HAR62782.1 FkbM family methyltransferase [Candidatus Margulisiibacteriota bacterium]HCY35691.1 FkbM family methyltransferase [Candidatus Margulisiibacteriota bacterium]
MIKRDTLNGLVSHISKLGFVPGTVIDIGAANGTYCLYDTFTSSRHLLIEPLIERENNLVNLKKKYKNLDYIIGGVGAKEDERKINVHLDHLDGSSLFKEQIADFDGIERKVNITTLDKLYMDLKLESPFLLKIDTQGSELEILNGASKVLELTECVVLEASFFEFYKGAPLIGEIVIFMKERGFVLYDIADITYRMLDGACAQIDLAFVKQNGFFRESNLYATIEQWNERS